MHLLRSPSLGVDCSLTEAVTTRAQTASQPSRKAMQSLVARRGLAARVSEARTSATLDMPSRTPVLRVLPSPVFCALAGPPAVQDRQ